MLQLAAMVSRPSLDFNAAAEAVPEAAATGRPLHSPPPAGADVDGQGVEPPEKVMTVLYVTGEEKQVHMSRCRGRS
jgi:hypothetical protein